MARPLIAITDSPFPSLDPARAALSRIGPDIVVCASGSEADILDVGKDADGILVTYAKLTDNLIRQLSKCKVIGRMGIGVDNIDLEAAERQGIAVTYVPDYCVHEVSDHTMAILLALARKVPQSDRLVQSGKWHLPSIGPLHRLKDRVIGLIGFGNIPRLVVPKAQAFGLKVIAFDPYAPADVFKRYDVASVGMDELLSTADFVSLHAPLTAETKGLLNAQAFRKMKASAMVINTARGSLINETDLLAALDAGEIGGAALDVVETEPLTSDSGLLGRDNVILTPHAGFYSVEALEELQTKAASDVARVLSSEDPIYPIRAGN